MDLVSIIAICVLPLVVWTKHQRKMRELELQYRTTSDPQVTAMIESLRRELMALRDTATQYDMSFDSALHRLESRVASLERPVTLSRVDLSNEESVLEIRSGR